MEKQPIRFSSHEEQDQRKGKVYWLSRPWQERLAEGERLRRKAFWQHYDADGNLPLVRVSRLFVKLESETTEAFFARVEREKKEPKKA